MRVIYVAGAYRAKTEWELVQNIRRAEEMALKIWQTGKAAAICPHKNSAWMGGAAEDSVWLEGYLEVLRRCDAVICVEGWRGSAGTCAEVELAKELGLSVFEEFEKLDRWLNEETTKRPTRRSEVSRGHV